MLLLRVRSASGGLDNVSDKDRPLLIAMPSARTAFPGSPHAKQAPYAARCLLRHRLLLQPHGFEGILGSLVHADCRDLAVANGPDVPVHSAFDCGAAAAATPRHSHEREDQVVANLLESLDLDLDFAPGLGELGRPLLNLTGPVPRPGVREMD